MLIIDRSVITDGGAALLNSGDPINITSVKTGSGTYTSSEDIKSRTALKSTQYSYTPSSVSVDGATRSIDALLSNYDPVTEQAIVTSDYTLTEVGLFATVNGADVLFAIGVSYDGSEVPAFTGQNKSEIIVNWDMAVSGTDAITITATGAPALAADLNNHVGSEVLSADGVHGIRSILDGENYNLQVKVNGNWVNASGSKSAASITPSESDVTITGMTGDTATVTLTVVGDGALSATSGDDSIATASLSGTTLTITATGNGSTTITVSMPETSQYTAAETTINVTCDVFVIGSTYKLGSGAHTAGSIDLECVVLDIIGTNAICQSKGIYGAAWPGISELTSIKSTYFGDLASAVSGLYLPRGNADGSETTTTPTDIFVYDGSSFVNTYSSTAKASLVSAATIGYSIGATFLESSLGTSYNAGSSWLVKANGDFNYRNKSGNCVIAPTFILDLTKVKLHGDRIIDKDAVVPKIVTWANGTDAEIVAMVQAADDGIIDLYADGGWRVGDERAVTLSAMQASGTASNGVSYSVDDTHVSQTVTLVLMNRGGKTLSGGGTCNFVFGLKNILANNGSHEGGYMNSTNTNVGGWNSCARRNWCNGAFYDAFPSTLRPILKQFINHTATGDSTAATDSTDWFALASEVEIFGATTYANATAETGNTQFEYYTTSANRIKNQGDTGSADNWWERSPYSGYSGSFCFVGGGGNAIGSYASNTLGLAPFGCI
jgi:hypothetical protein